MRARMPLYAKRRPVAAFFRKKDTEHCLNAKNAIQGKNAGIAERSRTAAAARPWGKISRRWRTGLQNKHEQQAQTHGTQDAQEVCAVYDALYVVVFSRVLM